MKNKNSKRGFTLIETLVAVTILSAAVAGPMVLSIKSIGSASVSQDQLVAFYLGQEVVEYVRNVRDTNLIKSNGWLDRLSDCKGANGSAGCYIDVINDSITDCGTAGS
jgi:prepilin-type N-terminal cleavage/methylation domain-containing protein